jgi:hypothetical protein
MENKGIPTLAYRARPGAFPGNPAGYGVHGIGPCGPLAPPELSPDWAIPESVHNHVYVDL